MNTNLEREVEVEIKLEVKQEVVGNCWKTFETLLSVVSCIYVDIFTVILKEKQDL